MSQGQPIRVAVVNDYEIVVAGVAAALEPYADRVAVVEIDSRLPVASDVDVILYDTFGAVQGAEVDVDSICAGRGARLVVFSWNTQRELVDGAVRAGASGYLSKALPAEQIVTGIERIVSGETVVPDEAEPVEHEVGSWPGREHGLTAREAEVLALITQGLSNQEIAQRTYLSINSVKTYIRTAYRKIGVERRSQAVGWGMRHGFEPDRVRSIDTTKG